MPHTTRTDAWEVACPNCDAKPGEKCVGARGRLRESVHRERMNAAAVALNHPPIATYRLAGDRLLDSEGHVVGHLTHVEFDMQSEALAGNLRRGEGDGVVDVQSSQDQPQSQSGSPEGSPERPQTELLPDPVEETWALYTELLERPKAVLTSKVRRWIAEAHKVGVEETRQAIRGLASSDYHRQNGYVGIEYAIVAKRGETTEGRLLMMAAKGGHSLNGPTTVDRLVARLPSEAQPMVRQWIRDVEDMLRNPDHPGLAQTGQSRLNSLRDRAQMEPIISGNRIVDWRDLRR